MICRRVKFFPSPSSSSFPSHLCPPLQCFLSYYGCPDTNVASKYPVKPTTQWCVSLCWGKVSLWSHNHNSGVLLTNDCWLSHHRFVRCFIQQAENWPEYLPGLLLHECRPSSFDYFWQWQQGEAAREAFSKDLLLNLTATVWPKSQIKHKLSFFS